MIDKLAVLYNDDLEEYGKFERVTNRTSNRPDLHAFNLLDRLVPGDCDILCSGGHDEIFLEVDPQALADAATPEQIIELNRCGVRYDSATDSLTLFI